MRFFIYVATIASVLTSVAAQEAARFGIVTVSPTTVNVGDTLTVTYNSTLSSYSPEFVDVYIQGSISSTTPTPQLLLQRNDYATGQKLLQFNVTIPPVYEAFESASSGWSVWAWITYPNAGVLQYSGTSNSLTITNNSD